MTKLLARCVFPVDQAPIERGVVEVVDGRIASVEPLRGEPDREMIDFGNAAIVPAFVNAHAHLEFTSLSAPIEPAEPFTGWIERLLTHRREREGTIEHFVAAGITETFRTGTGLVGDIVTGDWQADCVPRDATHVVAFRELIGFSPDEADGQLRMAEQHIAECRAARDKGHPRIAPALSPHAPYSVSPELFDRLVELAGSENVPLCIHLAETRAELELLREGTGEFREMLHRFALWQEGVLLPGSRPMDYLQTLAELPHALIAHGNYLTDDESAFLGQHPNIATVYCPRTHAYFGHDEHPWRRLLDTGAAVCLGTDGRSSNPDGSMWNELRFLDRQTEGKVRPALLDLATLSGARALGREDDFGSLTVGKLAALTFIPFGEEPSSSGAESDPWRLLFEAKFSPTVWTDPADRGARSLP